MDGPGETPPVQQALAVSLTGPQLFFAEARRGVGASGPGARAALRTTPGGEISMSPTAQEALGQVFRDHERDVRRLCRRMLADDAAAQDAASETFARAQQRLASYDETRPMRPWLLGIAANLCIDLIRRRGTEARIFDDAGADPEALADRAPSPLGHLLRAEERAELLSGIDALPVKYRLPLVLRHFAELDYDAIAELLGTSRNQVGSLLFRARQRLRIALGETSA